MIEFVFDASAIVLVIAAALDGVHQYQNYGGAEGVSWVSILFGAIGIAALLN